MNKLFNSVQEIQQRSLLLLNEYSDCPVSMEIILGMDFISVYGKEFNISNVNIHGNVPYKFAEIVNRRVLLTEAIRKSVIEGLLLVDIVHGYRFYLSNMGKDYVLKFEGSYAKKYLENAKRAISVYGEHNEVELMRVIRNHCSESIERRQ